MIDIKNYDFNAHVDRLVDIVNNNIKINKVTVLTGDNGSGKSLIRKCLWSGINKQLGITEKKPICADVSMQRRTGLHSELGGMGVFLRDNDWNPTSLETYHFIESLLRSLDNKEHRKFLIIDEPEIGCSRELQVAMGKYISKYYNDFINPNKCHGLLVITHSSDLVSKLKHDAFVNIQGMTEEEWINRPIEDVDLDNLNEFSNELFRTIQKRLK